MENTQEKIRTLWVPLRNMNLILPNAAVAEIGSYRKPEHVQGVPDWLLGKVRWREHDIPVLSLETLCGMEVTSNPVFSRLMVLNPVHPDSPVAHYAIVTAGLPGLIQFGADTAAGSVAAEHPALRCEVRIGNEQAAIPDLAWLQKLVEQQFRQAA